jgi:CRP-like cAMP-binding protein
VSLAADLRALAALREYPDAELAVLVAAAVEQRLAPGATLCREGEPGRSCFLLVSGEAQVLRATAEGDRPLATIGPGAFVGQIALVDRGPRSATVRAVTACVALELSRDAFEQLLAACSPLALRFQESIAAAGIRQLRQATAGLARLLAQAEARRPAAAAVATAAAATGAATPARDGAVLAYIQTAAAEWGVSLEDLDAVEVVAFDGVENRGARRPR